MRRTRPPTRGFTLLEVMIVIGMAALVMAISIPFVQRTIHRDAIYTAVHVVEDACRNARTQAILNNATAEMIIQPEERRFSVRPGASHGGVTRRQSAAARVQMGEDGKPRGPADYRRQAPPPYTGQLEDDVAIDTLAVNFIQHGPAQEAKVRFHPNGTSDEFTIVIRIGATAWREVSLDIVTGYPTIKVIR